jgi:ribonuclease P protein component
MGSFSFDKSERLTSRKIISALFQSSFSFGKSPIRFLWKVDKRKTETCKVLIAVPKRKFKNAAQRNRIKRLIKEAYRLNKGDLTPFFEEKGISCQLGIVYISSEMPRFNTINKHIQRLIERMPSEYEKHVK